MKGKCIDAADSTMLQIDREYFLFPAGPNNYYVSHFNNKNAHFGCYEASKFVLIKDDIWSPEPPIQSFNLDQDTFYRAQLIWRTKGHKNIPLKDYVIQPKKTHCFFWHDWKRERCCGCFPLHWFTHFEPITDQPEKEKEKAITFLERPGGQLAFF